MPTTVEQILRSFESLSEAEKYRLMRELLRWSALSPQPPLSDDALVAAADELFVALDKEESERE